MVLAEGNVKLYRVNGASARAGGEPVRRVKP